MKKISMIVPCYNEEKNVTKFFEEVKKVYENHKEYKLEIIFIDDGSTDDTLKELKNITNDKTFDIKVISFSRNFGKESAIFAGLKTAQGDYSLLIDADLQQQPSLTLKMAELLDKNDEYDCVCYCQENRKESKSMIWLKKTFYNFMNKISEVELKQGASDFRMFRKNVKDAILELEEYCRFSKGIFSWVGFNTIYLKYTPEERANGKTKWGFFKLFKYGINGIMSFSTTPLRISTILGLIMSLLSFLYLLVVFIQKVFFEVSVPGYPTIVICILLIGGIQLLFLGIIGEYIGKIYMEGKKRPLYITKEIITNDKESKKSL